MDDRNDPTGRIRVLQEQRVRIQKNTFTRWMNSYLDKVNMHVNDMFTDLADGKMLMKLLEIISGEKIGRPNKGVLRVQKVENVNRALEYIKGKVVLENIGAEDIVDGNPRLILGLIWTIILRFEIQEIEIELEDGLTGEKKSAKDALLLWCQRKTAGYANCQIEDFHKSWRSGMAFNALLHAHRPDIINYNRLNPANHIENLNNAFNVAQEQLDIPKLLDAEDIDVPRPDDKSVITYVSSMYHTFAKMKLELKGAKRVENIMNSVLKADESIRKYEASIRDLIEWIARKLIDLDNRYFGNTVDSIQNEMLKFKQYRTVEKPPKYQQRGDIDGLLFEIIQHQKFAGMKNYFPAEGFLIKDVESAWNRLEKAEHRREVALRDKLSSLEKLEQEAERFQKKSRLRESWLADMTRVVQDLQVGKEPRQIEAAKKQLESVAADIQSRESRFSSLNQQANRLIEAQYHGRDAVARHNQQIQQSWRALCSLLRDKQEIMSSATDQLNVLRDLAALDNQLDELEPVVASSVELGRHLEEVQELLERHKLAENQLGAIGLGVDALKKKKLLKKEIETLASKYDRIVSRAAIRRAKLEGSLALFQFLADCLEEEAWLVEKGQHWQSKDVGKDLLGTIRLKNRHEREVAELAPRSTQFDALKKRSAPFVSQVPEVVARMDTLTAKWQRLHELSAARARLLEDALESQQYYADANEAEMWLMERMPLATSKELGVDQSGASALLKRHETLQQEVASFGQSDVARLRDMATLMTQSSDKHQITPDKLADRQKNLASAVSSDSESDAEPLVIDEKESEPQYTEEWVEVERVREVAEERLVPQVRALHNYDSRDTSGRDISVRKGEVLQLLSKSTNEWWAVRNPSTKKDGYVPANYMTEIEPRKVTKMVRKPVKVREKRRVPVVKSPASTSVKKVPSLSKQRRNLRRAPSARTLADLHFDKDNVNARQTALERLFNDLESKAALRADNLKDAIHVYRFFSECDILEEWMKEKEASLSVQDNLSQDVEGVKKKYEKIMNDLAANRGRLDEINRLAKELLDKKHTQSDKLKRRLDEINERWKRLNDLKIKKQKTLAGVGGIELFNRTVAEARDWLDEKLAALGDTDVGRDAATNQVLCRRHENLMRDMAPLEEKINKVHFHGDGVKTAFPNESDYVDSKTNEIDRLWDKLRNLVDFRRHALEKENKKHKFTGEARDLAAQMDTLLAKLHAGELPRSAKEAEEFLANHKTLEDDAKALDEVLARFEALGRELLRNNPEDKATQDLLNRLAKKRAELADAFARRGHALQDAAEAQKFFQEADQLDTLTAQLGRQLDLQQHPKCVADVERQLKALEDLSILLDQQAERAGKLSRHADSILASGKHPEADRVASRRAEVLEHRAVVKKRAHERKLQLLHQLDFQQLRQDVEEQQEWLDEKLAIAGDDNYRDLLGLDRKLQRHHAFELEIAANRAGLVELQDRCEKLCVAGNPQKKEAIDLLQALQKEWDKLEQRSHEKAERLKQAVSQKALNRALCTGGDKLGDMEKALDSKKLGSDLRQAKDLLQHHKTLQDDMVNQKSEICDLVNMGKALAQADHFDAAAILDAIADFDERYDALAPRVEARGSELAASLCRHQLCFDVDSQLQWIAEKMPLAAANADVGRSLAACLAKTRQHEKLVAEVAARSTPVHKILATGADLLKVQDAASNMSKIEFALLDSKCKQLESDWCKLEEICAARSARLAHQAKLQEYLNDTAELTQWLKELVASQDSTERPKDLGMVERDLVKNKNCEAALIAQLRNCKELEQRAEQLASAMAGDEEEASGLRRRQADLSEQLDLLSSNAALKHSTLNTLKDYFVFVNECDDLEQWTTEHLVIASTEDYGQDWEHLVQLQQSFKDFKANVDANRERFDQLASRAEQLVHSANPQAADIVERAERVHDDWELLLEHIDAREHKLMAAGEIHRFNRDVQEAALRIHEKREQLPKDCGKDLQTLQGYIKRHEAFETELGALESMLNDLFEESARLQEQYPGGNAKEIASSEAQVRRIWEDLLAATEQRRQQLADAERYYRLANAVRTLLQWTGDAVRQMGVQADVNNVQAAEALLRGHQELGVELRAKEELFTELVQEGESCCENGSLKEQEIQDLVDELLVAKMKVMDLWESRDDHLKDVLLQQVFLRDAAQLNALCASQEAALRVSGLGDSPQQTENRLRKQEALEKVVDGQDAKEQKLVEEGEQLLSSKHFDKNRVKEIMNEVKERRRALRQLLLHRRGQMELHLRYLIFLQSLVETRAWMEDKLAQLRSASKEAKDLQDKVRQLRRHTVLEAELLANAGNVDGLRSAATALINEKHPKAVEIEKDINELIAIWNKLLADVDIRSHELEEAKDILRFQDEVETIDAWLREKELLAQANELGHDLEHCLALQRRISEPVGGKQVDQARLEDICLLAQQLITEGQSNTDQIAARRDALLKRWDGVASLLEAYDARLVASKDVHEFNRDADDLVERIRDKTGLLTSTDCGHDLSSVEALLRQQERVERDISALQKQLHELEQAAKQLKSKRPEKVDYVDAKMKSVEEEWNLLEQRSLARNGQLQLGRQFQKVRSDAAALSKWASDMQKEVNALSLPTNLKQAEAALEQHEDRQAENEGRQNNYLKVKAFGEQLISQVHPQSQEIQVILKELDETFGNLTSLLEEKKDLFHQAAEFQKFKTAAFQMDTRLSRKEENLLTQQVGSSLAEVQECSKLHEAFCQSLAVEDDSIGGLQKNADELIAKKNFAMPHVNEVMKQTTQRYKSLLNSANAHREKLQQAQLFYIFSKRCQDLKLWISVKMAVAQDENFKDVSNIQAKEKKHDTFYSEVLANQSGVDAVKEEAAKYCAIDNFFAKSNIQLYQKEVQQQWTSLLAACELKKKRIGDCVNLVKFLRQHDTLERAFEEVETELASEDYGKNLVSVKQLLKVHESTAADVMNVRREQVKELVEQGRELAKSNFRGREITEHVEKISDRYEQLLLALHHRHKNLVESAELFQVYRDFDDELAWIQDKIPLATSTDVGSSVSEASRLAKRLAALQADIKSHEPTVQKVDELAQEMISKSSFAAGTVRERLQQLRSKLKYLRDSTALREKRLEQALLFHIWMADACEVDAWLEEHWPLLISRDMGQDEDSVLALLRKLDALRLDTEFQRSLLKELRKKFDVSLKSHESSERDAASQRLKYLEARFTELEELTESRKDKLEDKLKYFKYARETAELTVWMKVQLAVAASEDYGDDYEHCQILNETFKAFIRDVTSKGDRAAANNAACKLLLQEQSGSHKSEIKELNGAMNRLWAEVLSLTQSRKIALVGALQVHAFDREADDTLEWIEEKAVAVERQEYGNSLIQAQDLQRAHEGFLRDLEPLLKQIDKMRRDEHRLSELYPDAEAHLVGKLSTVEHAFEQLQARCTERSNHLQQAIEIQVYFDSYRELMAWCADMSARIGADQLATDVAGAQVLVSRNHEHHVEIEARRSSVERFKLRAQRLLRDNEHFLAEEIREKMASLDRVWSALLQLAEARRDIYVENLDLRVLLAELLALENWLMTREDTLQRAPRADSIPAVEELLKKHEDFEKTVLAHGSRFDAVKRLTKLEKKLAHSRRHESAVKHETTAARMADIKRSETRRLQDLKLQRQQAAAAAAVAEVTLEPQPVLEVKTSTPVVSSSSNFREAARSEAVQSILNKSKKSSTSTPASASRKRSVSSSSNDSDSSSDSDSNSAFDTAPVSPVTAESTATTSVPKVPSFSTRRSAASSSSPGTESNASNRYSHQPLPAPSIEGYLERKQDLLGAGRRAPVRGWKPFYAALCGHQLAFFKEKSAFENDTAALTSLAVHGSQCQQAVSYTKRKNVLELHQPDGAVYLLWLRNPAAMVEWMQKINFVSVLPPQRQLSPAPPSVQPPPPPPPPTIVRVDTIKKELSSQRHSEASLVEQRLPNAAVRFVSQRPLSDAEIATKAPQPSNVTIAKPDLPGATASLPRPQSAKLESPSGSQFPASISVTDSSSRITSESMAARSLTLPPSNKDASDEKQKQRKKKGLFSFRRKDKDGSK